MIILLIMLNVFSVSWAIIERRRNTPKNQLITQRKAKKEIEQNKDTDTDFDKAIHCLTSGFSQWQLHDSAKTWISNVIKKDIPFTVSDIYGKSPFEAIDRVFLIMKTGFRMDTFSPSEKAEIVKVYLNVQAKKIDDYVESVSLVLETVDDASKKHRHVIQSRKELKESLDPKESWNQDYEKE